MGAFTKTLSEFAALVEKLPARCEHAVIRALQDTALEGVGIVVSEIDATKSVYNGDLRRSVRAELTPRGAVLRVDAPHAAVVEYGRRADRKPPPTAPIALWAVRKLGLSPKEAESVAWAIAHKIGKKGIKPKKFFARALRRIRARLDVNVRRALDSELAK